MDIDWFTLAAQLINFFVLVGLLRWFLYDPIMNAMEQRENRISERLQEADEKRKQADQEAEEYHEKRRRIDEERDQLMDEAREEARETRERLLKESRHSVTEHRDEWLTALKREKDRILDDFRQQVGKMAEAAARQALKNLADQQLEERIEQQFLHRFRELDEESLEEIKSHVSSSEQAKVLLQSAFETSASFRKELEQAIQEKLDLDTELRAEVAPEVICGIELDLAGFQLGWSLREHLRDLSAEFEERMRHEAIEQEATESS